MVEGPILAATPEGVKLAISQQIAKGRLGKLRKPGRPMLRKRAERLYRRAMNAHFRAVQALLRQRLLPIIPAIVAEAPPEIRGPDRQDAFSDRLVQIIDGVIVAAGTLLDIETISRAVTGQASEDSQATEQRMAQTVLGVQPILSEPWLEDLVQDFTDRNARLIQRVNEDFLTSVRERVSDGVRSGLRAEQIARLLERDFIAQNGEQAGIAKRRLKLIARDQVASFNADLTKARQTQIGVKKFIWRTSRDERVRGRPVSRQGQRIGGRYPKARPNHTTLEGKTFEWSKGAPGVGIPGQPINCRCIAEPVFEDLIET